MKVRPVVLCGGSGLRLWPLSRPTSPKQFAPLTGPESLYQACLRRVTGELFAEPLVVTGADVQHLAGSQAAVAGAPTASFLVEPMARNTGPAVLCAALTLSDQPNEVMLVAPSDHAMGDASELAAAVRAGLAAAEEGRLVTFGIAPDRPATEFGYLELAAAPEAGALRSAPVLRFVEKPDAVVAAEMLATGRFLWNAGIFLFRVRDILEAFSRRRPDLLAPCREAVEKGRRAGRCLHLDPRAFAGLPDISIDYAVMERADNVSVVPFAGRWSDLGAWRSLWAEMARDTRGVATAGPVTAIDCEDSLLRAEEDSLLLVGIGLRRIVAVATADAVLVADLGASANVKRAVATLQRMRAPQVEVGRRVAKPWGWFETLESVPGFQVKRLNVKPGGLLSLQSHAHRREHWYIVAGAAVVTVGSQTRPMSADAAVDIPAGVVHRLGNAGDTDLNVIEIQTGAYLGEDDITRFDDAYGRR